jgi:hypothetical protein
MSVNLWPLFFQLHDRGWFIAWRGVIKRQGRFPRHWSRWGKP